MAIQHLTSSTANKRPTPAAMADAQIAINSNTASPGLFFKDSAGALIKVGPVHVGTTAPNASPASGGQTGNSVGEQWLDTTGGTYVFKVWDGSAWRSETGTFVDVNGDTMTGALGIIAGSASTPGLFISGDTNTGIYSPSADQLAISTNGARRLLISNGQIQADTLFSVAMGGVGYQTIFRNGANEDNYITHGASGFTQFRNHNGSEYMRLDSSGRLGVGTSAPNTNYKMTIEGNSSGVGPVIAFSDTVASPNNYTIGINGSKNFFIDGPSAASFDFVLDSSGRLGLGTSSPGGKLTVIGTGSNVIQVSDNSTYTFELGRSKDNAGSFGYIGGTGGTGLTFGANDTEYMRLDTSGRLGIGTTALTEKLHVDGNIVTKSGDYGILFGDSTCGINGDTTSDYIKIYTANAERARIDSSGRFLVGTSSVITNSYGSNAGRFQVAKDDYLPIGFFTFSNSGGENGYCPYVELHRARGTQASPSAVASNDDLGLIHFYGHDGSTFLRAASIKAVVDGTPGDNDMPGRLVFSTTADGASSPTERMRITSGGEFWLNTTTGSIGTADFGVASNANVFAISRNRSASEDVLRVYGTAGQFRTMGDGDAENTNNAYGAISDVRLKENIVDANSQWNDLKALQVRNYNFKAETGYSTHTQIGLVAQEVELVSPGLVGESIDEETGESTKSVNYSVLYMKAVKALQEAMERIEQLETEMAAVKAQLS